MPKPIRLAVLLSGSGSTLQNLLDRGAEGRLNAAVVGVVSSNPTAFGLERARRAGIITAVVPRKSSATAQEFGQRIFAFCREREADLVCMAGFLQLLPIAPDFRQRVLNIHPSLIPAFCGKGYHGLHVHEAVLAAGVQTTGCTVHFADDEYDHGPIILQRTVPVLAGDSAETLAARVFAAECEAYPEAIQMVADGLRP
jgi:phosphoribosylglycinamide formyltransferase-1